MHALYGLLAGLFWTGVIYAIKSSKAKKEERNNVDN
jgi:hypothetical protein